MIVQRLRFVLIGTALFTALTAHAQVEVEANAGLLAAKISEEIVPGDYEKLLRGLRANPGKHTRKVVLLDSIGGSVPEAIRMGRLLRELGFSARVPEGALCQGTCVYLLAAGRDKQVLGHVRRKPRLVDDEVSQVTEQLCPNHQCRIGPAPIGLGELRGFIGKVDLGVIEGLRQRPVQSLASGKQAAAGLAGIVYPFAIIEVLLNIFGSFGKAAQHCGLCAQCLVVDLL